MSRLKRPKTEHAERGESVCFITLLVPIFALNLVCHSLAEYLDGEPARKKAQVEAQKAKLEALERKLGIAPGDKGKEKEVDATAGVKRRFDDTEYLEQSKEIVDGVKNAVTAGQLVQSLALLSSADSGDIGLLKKRKKKAKSDSTESPVASAPDAGPSTSVGDASPKETETIAEKILEAPEAASIAAVTAISLAAVGA